MKTEYYTNYTVTIYDDGEIEIMPEDNRFRNDIPSYNRKMIDTKHIHQIYNDLEDNDYDDTPDNLYLPPGKRIRSITKEEYKKKLNLFYCRLIANQNKTTCNYCNKLVTNLKSHEKSVKHIENEYNKCNEFTDNFIEVYMKHREKIMQKQHQKYKEQKEKTKEVIEKFNMLLI